jgi:hypothetical protein
VAQAHAQILSATDRVKDAEAGLREAVESSDKNLEGMGKTTSPGRLVALVIRPQEVVASVQALALAGSGVRAVRGLRHSGPLVVHVPCSQHASVCGCRCCGGRRRRMPSPAPAAAGV